MLQQGQTLGKLWRPVTCRVPKAEGSCERALEESCRIRRPAQARTESGIADRHLQVDGADTGSVQTDPTVLEGMCESFNICCPHLAARSRAPVCMAASMTSCDTNITPIQMQGTLCQVPVLGLHAW